MYHFIIVCELNLHQFPLVSLLCVKSDNFFKTCASLEASESLALAVMTCNSKTQILEPRLINLLFGQNWGFDTCTD
jgi:hypothetical protein